MQDVKISNIQYWAEYWAAGRTNSLIGAGLHNMWLLCLVYYRDGTGESESQIVRTPLRGFYDCMGKPDRIVFSLKSPIDFTVF